MACNFFLSRAPDFSVHIQHCVGVGMDVGHILEVGCHCWSHHI
jgi:hypothetical protein